MTSQLQPAMQEDLGAALTLLLTYGDALGHDTLLSVAIEAEPMRRLVALHRFGGFTHGSTPRSIVRLRSYDWTVSARIERIEFLTCGLLHAWDFQRTGKPDLSWEAHQLARRIGIYAFLDVERIDERWHRNVFDRSATDGTAKAQQEQGIWADIPRPHYPVDEYEDRPACSLCGCALGSWETDRAKECGIHENCIMYLIRTGVLVASDTQ